MYLLIHTDGSMEKTKSLNANHVNGYYENRLIIINTHTMTEMSDMLGPEVSWKDIPTAD